MKLLTKKIENQFKKIGRQSNEPDPIVVAKFFNPCGGGTWHATEYEPDDEVFYGYVTGLFEDEWGRFSLRELEAFRHPISKLGIERDRHCGTKRISEHCPELKPKIELQKQRIADRQKGLER